MLNPTTVIISSLTESLKAGYRNTYGNIKSDSARLIEQVVNLALEKIASSDALYHNVEHTVLVTLVGQEILRGKYLSEGNISPENWLEAIVSWLCHDIGYVKGICPQDQQSQRLYATGTDSNTIYLESGTTDASLTPYHIDRGKMFVKEHFLGHDLIDSEAIVRNIELTRFPVPNDEEHSCTGNYAGLVRAADLLGQLSDPRYLQKIPALFYEFEEIGSNKNLGYRNPADLRSGYPKFFWNVVYPYIQEGLQHLKMTAGGQEIIANLYGNVLTVEKEIASHAATSAVKSTHKLLADPRGFQFPNFQRFRGLSDSFSQRNKNNRKSLFVIGNG